MKGTIFLGICFFTFLFCNAAMAVTITTTLDSTPPPANAAYTATTGQQSGVSTRLFPVSTCGTPHDPPVPFSFSGSRQYDAYVFTASVSGCVAVRMTALTDNLFVTAYRSPGFVPNTPWQNWMADPVVGPSNSTVTFFFDVVAGESFTVVVRELDPGTGFGDAYILRVDPVTPTTVTTTLDNDPPPINPVYVRDSGVISRFLLPNGIVSKCNIPKETPQLSPVFNFYYDSYVFTASRTGCATVTLAAPPNSMLSATYDEDGFIPGTPDFNYMADGGRSGPNIKYSFKVTAGKRFTVVVHELGPLSGTGDQYTLRVSEAVSQTPCDFDSDNITDVGIFRPSTGTWWVDRSDPNFFDDIVVQFGTGTDRIVPADYTGDGRADIAIWRPSNGSWYVLRSNTNTFYAVPFGTNGDIPVPGDFDADGQADPTVFRPSNSTWFTLRSIDGGATIQQFGISGDVPVPSDYDGDGRADVAIYRPSVGQWWMNRSSAGVMALTFGNSSDKPVQGDYTGDGKADNAIWRPSTGEWFILRSENFSYYAVPFGLTNDVPGPGDFDGDGRFDPTVFRPSNATWYSQRSRDATLIQQWGAAGDRPVSNAFVP